MKYLLLLLLPLLSFSQTIEYEGKQYVLFQPEHVSDSLSPGQANRSHLCSQFTLGGNIPLQCSIGINNDSIALLSVLVNDKWQLQEKVPITDWTLSRTESGKIISEIEITDFDTDGDEDILFHVFTNISGNVWTVIYLNDQETKRLVKLESIEDDGLWINPVYSNSTIQFHFYSSSVFGENIEGTHKLEGLKATPLESHIEHWHNERVWGHYDYSGNGNGWKLSNQQIDIGLDIEQPLVFTLEQQNPTNALLTRYTDVETHTQQLFTEKVIVNDWLTEIDSQSDKEGFKITDFNEDGFDDVLINTFDKTTNKAATLILLQDNKNRNLLKLHNTAEGTDYWQNPVYSKKNHTITCSSDRSTSIYKLNRYKVRPLVKKQYRPAIDSVIISEFKGRGNKWKLKKTTYRNLW